MSAQRQEDPDQTEAEAGPSAKSAQPDPGKKKKKNKKNGGQRRAARNRRLREEASEAGEAARARWAQRRGRRDRCRAGGRDDPESDGSAASVESRDDPTHPPLEYTEAELKAMASVVPARSGPTNPPARRRNPFSHPVPPQPPLPIHRLTFVLLPS